VPYIYAFDHKHRRAPKELKDLLGGKGANLAEMMSVLKLPVPHGFTISTDACRAYMHGGWPKGLDEEVKRHVAALEKKMGRKLGDSSDPLLVSVRSGAKFSMPGMMDTVLNLGLNDKSVVGIAKNSGDERFAYDSYRRFIAMYGRIVLGIEGEKFEHSLEDVKHRTNSKTDADIPAVALKELCVAYKEVVAKETGKPFPQ
jgi:pyruvate,orthophosphate dikinase